MPKDDSSRNQLIRQQQGYVPATKNPPEGEQNFLRELIELQREQIAIRQEEINAAKQKALYAHEYSLKNLDAMAKDRADARTHGKSDRRDRLVFAGIIIVALLSFLILAMHLGQADIAKEFVKGIGFLLVGAFGGYNYGVRKSKKQKEE